MEYSKQLKKLASQFAVDVPTLAMADLVIAGYSEEDAFAISHGHLGTLAPNKLEAKRESIVTSKNYQRILSEKANLSTTDDTLIDSETALKQLLRQIQKMPDGKEKADLYAKYMESMRKSSAAPEDEDSRVQIYLPLKCRECSLYLNRDKKTPLNPKIPQ